jgi:hypothetical protein
MKMWIHALVLVLVGYTVAYYWRGLGNATLGKLKASTAA